MVERDTLWLLRHGETTAGGAYIGRSDPPLTPNGWRQMHAAVASAPGWQSIYSSPRQRCLAFAEQLAAQHQCDVQVLDAFAEYDFGIMEGLTAQQVIDQHPGVLDAFWHDPVNCPPPGAESLTNFEARLRRGLTQIDLTTGPALLVCHGGVIRALRCLEQQQPVAHLLQYSAPHGELYLLSSGLI